MSVSDKMTAIANKIRALLGISGVMGLDDMATNLTTTQNNVDAQADLIEQISSVLEGKAGTIIIEPTIAQVSVTPSSNSTSISFTGVTAEPKMFSVSPTGNISLGTTRYVTGVSYDGTTTHGTYGYRSSSSGTSYYSASYFTWEYSDETLTIKTSSSTNGGNFKSGTTYIVTYVA